MPYENGWMAAPQQFWATQMQSRLHSGAGFGGCRLSCSIRQGNCCWRAGGKLVIVNLQATPKDSKAHLLLHGRTDKVMRILMELLREDIPDYVREDRVAISTCQEGSSSAEGYRVTLSISSVHGASCPLPLVQSVDVHFQAGPCACSPCLSCNNPSRTACKHWKSLTSSSVEEG